MAIAPLAIFFSLATTFSLPGMTTYSVAKSPSRSTPSLLLGRSLMCPSEASTSKSFPRYLLMVFALAGDSTMTNDFGNSLKSYSETNILRKLLATSCYLLEHLSSLCRAGQARSFPVSNSPEKLTYAVLLAVVSQDLDACSQA